MTCADVSGWARRVPTARPGARGADGARRRDPAAPADPGRTAGLRRRTAPAQRARAARGQRRTGRRRTGAAVPAAGTRAYRPAELPATADQPARRVLAA